MAKKKSTWKNFFAIFFCAMLIFSCKNEKQTKSKNTPPQTNSSETSGKTVGSEEISSFLKQVSKNELSHYETLSTFYKARDYAPIWGNEKMRSSLYKQLKKANEEGLFFNDYHGKTLQKFHENKENLEKKKRIRREILLTDAFLKYADHLWNGKLNPKEMYPIWGINRKKIDLAAVLQKAVKEQEIEQAFSKLKPQNRFYSGLKKSLSEYRKKIKAKKNFIKIPAGETIRPGQKDARIPAVAKRLKQLGFLGQDYVSQNSLYDSELQSAVKKFQSQKNLATDKVIGNATLGALNTGAKEHYQQLLVNLERWRWYPRSFGNHYILINIPNYKLALVKNGDTLQTHKVIVGKATNQTPVFSDIVQYIVINPEWHIPTSIRNNEIIPAAANNPNYLQSRNIYVTGPDGDRIDPSTINWSGKEARSYRFTQGSGPSNSLGRVKIIYPNQYAIYLHDTPAQYLFNRNSRSKSHGCVRVKNALDLAAYLVGNQKGWDLKKIKEIIATGETKQVKVTQPVQVYHLYWTAWRENGKTHFIHDIYKLDEEIYTALTK